MIVLSWLWGIVKSVLNTIAKAVAFAVILVIILAGIGLVSGDGLPSNMVLELDARKSIADKSANGLLDLGDRSLSVMDIVMTLDTAQRDSRVKGVFMRVGSGDLSVPRAEELRDALKRFRAAGKFVDRPFAELLFGWARRLRRGRRIGRDLDAAREHVLQRGLFDHGAVPQGTVRQGRGHAAIRAAARVQERREHVHGNRFHAGPSRSDAAHPPVLVRFVGR